MLGSQTAAPHPPGQVPFKPGRGRNVVAHQEIDAIHITKALRDFIKGGKQWRRAPNFDADFYRQLCHAAPDDRTLGLQIIGCTYKYPQYLTHVRDYATAAKETTKTMTRPGTSVSRIGEKFHLKLGNDCARLKGGKPSFYSCSK